QAPRHAEQAGHIERHEHHVKAKERKPERGLAPTFVQLEAERLGEPVGDAGKAANTTPAMMTLWKWATRNRLLCSKKSAGGTARSTPVRPPIVNVTRNPNDHSIGVVKRMRPPYIVNSQL